MTAPPSRRARPTASADLPEAVGPAISTASGRSPRFAGELLPVGSLERDEFGYERASTVSSLHERMTLSENRARFRKSCESLAGNHRAARPGSRLRAAEPRPFGRAFARLREACRQGGLSGLAR